MKPSKKWIPSALVVVLLSGVLGTLSLRATPYASSLTNSGTSISFRLNESADNVKILSDGGATENDLGALPAGLHTANLTIAGNYEVVVSKSSGLGWLTGDVLQISDDGANEVKFWAPRGVDVNKSPGPNLGRVYVSNAQNGTSSGRAVTDGIYVLNSDLTDAVGQGDTALTGGIEWVAATGDTAKPWQIGVGEDDNLYIADWTEETGGIYVVDGDVSAGSGVKVVDGFIPSGVVAQGSLGGGDLKVYALEGLTSPINRARLWDIGSGPLPFAGGDLQLHDDQALLEIQNVNADVEIGPDGKIYLLQNRFNGTEDGLIIADPNVDFFGGGDFGDEPNGLADLVYFSLGDTRNMSGNPEDVDLLRRARALQLSPGGGFLAIIHDLGDIYIVPLINGLPDLANLQTVAAGVGFTIGRDIAFDAAFNIYTVHSGNERLRVFSPGLESTATTGSDGSFSVAIAAPATPTHVEIVGTDVDMFESDAGDTATIRFSSVRDLANPLTVNFTLGGTAVEGTDYQAIGSSFTIPAGQFTADLTLVPIDNALVDGPRTIEITLAAGAYELGDATTVTATILDDEVTTVELAGTDVNIYERIPEDTASLTFSRVGNTSAALNIDITVGGTAVEGTDYQAIGTSVEIPAGENSAILTVVGIDNSLFEGDKTIEIAIAPNGYELGASTSASITIRDDESEPGTVLWADDFETDTSANYNVLFDEGLGGTTDFLAAFSYDYSVDGIPPAPHSVGGTTRGLKLQVNFDGESSAAALNVYPIGQNFSGNFALRADMLISFGQDAGGQTEHSILGINHSGTQPNRHTVSNDGVWFAIDGDASGNRGFAYYEGDPGGAGTPTGDKDNNPEFSGIFTSPPWGAVGSPNNVIAPDLTPSGMFWADAEITFVSGVITIKVNNTEIFSFLNTSGFANGTVMIGHNDQFNSTGSLHNYTIFDNVRVVELPSPPQAVVQLLADGSFLSERQASAGTLTFTRTGGDMSVALTVNYTVAGTAVGDTDYSAIGTSVVIPATEASASVSITPIDNALADGDRTVIVELAPDGYEIDADNNTATVTILDDDLPSGTVVYSESFETDTSAQFGVNTTSDASATFAYDYSADGIPAAPNSGNGGGGAGSRGLKFQANVSSGTASAVSVSPTGQNFAGDHILYFDMWINVNGPFPGGGGGSTEFLTGGLGVTDDTQVIWANNASSSGGWFAVDGEGGSGRDYRPYKGNAEQFPESGQYIAPSQNNSDSYYSIAFPGGQEAPAAQQSAHAQQTGALAAGTVGFAWREVAIAKLGNQVKWLIDGLPIVALDTAVGAFSTEGNIFVGYMDIFTSVSDNPALSFGLVDNVRVVSLTPLLNISQVSVSGTDVIIDFTADAGDTPASFSLQKSADAAGPYTTDAGAAITERDPTGTGLFRATTPVDGDAQFYFIQK